MQSDGATQQPHTAIPLPSSPIIFPFGKIPRLDFLRTVSAALVVIYHAHIEWAPAGFGVLTFFVISGFLITHLLILETAKTGTVSLKAFYARRSLRIFPAFLAYWIVVVLARVFAHKPPFNAQVISALLYVSNYYQGLHGYPSTALSHIWSLSIEEQFYLLWPFVFLLMCRRLRTLGQALCIVLPLLWLYRVALCIVGVSDAYLYTAFETRVDAILAGCLFAILLHTGLFTRAIHVATRPRYLLLTLAALLLSVFHPWHMQLDYRYTIGYAVEPLLVCLFLLQFIRYDGAKWIDSRIFAYLGKISYSTYLYQQVVHPFAERLNGVLPQYVVAAMALLLTWAVASVSFFVVERPALRLKSRLHPASRGAAADPLPAT